MVISDELTNVQKENDAIKKYDNRWPDDYCLTMELATFIEDQCKEDICIKTQKRFCCNYFYVLLKSGMKRLVVTNKNVTIFDQDNFENWNMEKDLFQLNAKCSNIIKFKSRQEMYDKVMLYVCS